MTPLWNNPYQVRSHSKDWKDKQFESVWNQRTKTRPPKWVKVHI